MEKIIAVSGGFDPLHDGHIAMIREAAKLGKVVIILNGDDFLVRKKGFRLLPYDVRRMVMEHIKGVNHVMPCVDEDQTVCKTLEALRPDVFVKAGDRNADNIPERETCDRLGVEIVYVETDIGKTSHSSDFVRAAQAAWGVVK